VLAVLIVFVVVWGVVFFAMSFGILVLLIVIFVKLVVSAVEPFVVEPSLAVLACPAPLLSSFLVGWISKQSDL